MPVLTVTPTSVDVAQSTSTWTTSANAYDASTTTFATKSITGTSFFQTETIALAGFNFSNIPPGSTINSVSATIYQNLSSPTNRWAQPYLYLQSTSLSRQENAGLSTSSSSSNFDNVTVPNITAAMLKASDFVALYSVTYTSTSGTGTANFGYISLTVDYSTETWGSLYL